MARVGDKPLVWLYGEIKPPPFSTEARTEAGVLLRRLQRGEFVSLPHSRPMPSIGSRCHELRVVDRDQAWRLIYRIDRDAIVLLDVFSKKTRETPVELIERCRARLRRCDEAAG